MSVAERPAAAADFGRLGAADWAAVWASLAVLSACWLATAEAAASGGARWNRPLAIHLGSLLLWALLSVPLVRLARRRPMHLADGLSAKLGALALGLTLAVAAAVAHALALATALAATLPAADWLTAWTPLATHALRHNLAFDVLVAGLVLFAAEGVGWYRRLEERRVETARLTEQVALERFAAARLRLRPRFLFRSLAAIAQAISTDPRRAERLILDLAALLRTVLEAGEDDVATVREELDFAHAYLAVERERLGPELDYAIDVAAAARLDAELPRRSLQPLLEAAVDAVGQRRGRVELRVDSSPAGLRCEVETWPYGEAPDDGPARLAGALATARALLDRRLAAGVLRSWCRPTEAGGVLAGFEFDPAQRAESAAARPAIDGEEASWSRSSKR